MYYAPVYGIPRCPRFSRHISSRIYMISVYCDVPADLDVSISLKKSLEKFKIILKFFNICFRSWEVSPGQTTFYISVHRIPMCQDIVFIRTIICPAWSWSRLFEPRFHSGGTSQSHIIQRSRSQDPGIQASYKQALNLYKHFWAKSEQESLKVRVDKNFHKIILLKTRRLVGVHSGYMVLVSRPQNGQWQCGMLPAGKLCVMQIV